jgi:ABC-2 type transport system permease protein
MKNIQSRLLSIARKEFFHIIRDPRTLAIIFLMPVIQLVMFGYALNLEIQRVDVAVIDYDQSLQSRHLIEQFEGSEFFYLFFFDGTPEEAEELFLKRKARVIMIIPQDFGKKLRTNTFTPVQILIDAADPNAAVSIQNYCNQVINMFNARFGSQIPLPFEVQSSIWFNPDLKSVYFFVPGILALILVMISALLTSITITREKETGTLEQILVSPVRPYEIILGKVIPYIFLGFLDGIIILLIGLLLFEVPFIGSAFLLALLTTLYIITALSLGLMISTITQTQQVAMMVAIIATLLPTVMLSGFIFPIASMPGWLQLISYIVPAKYYLVIVRGIMLKGNTIFQLLTPTLLLGLMSAILLTVSWRKFSLNLEK